MARLLDWFARHARDLPWRKTRDPYAIWVSEVMLQQTQVKTVVPYWERWMRALPTMRALAKASPRKIHKLWEGLGYYTRVRNLQRAARIIVRQHGGRFPEEFAEILALPGVGRYTAGAICSIAFHQPAPVLDGNVIRVLTRLFGIAGDPRETETNALLWRLAERFVTEAANGTPRSTRRATQREVRSPQSAVRSSSPGANCSHLNQSLMELGAVVCTPRRPNCRACPVAAQCVAFRTGRVGEFPAAKPRPAATVRRFAAFVVECDGRFLVRRRPAGGVNAHLWEWPNVEIGNGGADLGTLAQTVLGAKPKALDALCTIRHSITRYRITLEAHVVALGRNRRGPPPAGRWVTPAGLERLPFASAHGKIRQRLLATSGKPREDDDGTSRTE